ncbi:MAG: hypothetical protein Q4F84_07180 [Fibrobacter sp.]|nr:hypothetical protein [Fibrobacter sp.]
MDTPSAKAGAVVRSQVEPQGLAALTSGEPAIRILGFIIPIHVALCAQ